MISNSYILQNPKNLSFDIAAKCTQSFFMKYSNIEILLIGKKPLLEIRKEKTRLNSFINLFTSGVYIVVFMIAVYVLYAVIRFKYCK